MRKLKLLALLLVVGLVVAVPAVAYAKHAATATGKANLPQFNQSGVKGTINFDDNGVDENVVSGTAWGLNPAGTYVSLIYDNRSLPGGPLACEPAIFDPADPDFILETMFVGFWEVDSEGHGTLMATNFSDEPFEPTSYVPLSKIKTISIREIVSFEPFIVPVRACGLVAEHKASNG